MTTSKRTSWMVAAALLLAAEQVVGQVQVNQQGRALDANTRVGGGGNAPTAPYPRVTGNQIVTGNVTGGREFRGFVPYTDPREFRGQLPSAQFDNFIKNSVGVPGPNQGQTIPGQARPFYGTALVTPPPPGFVERGFTGTYTPPPQPLTPDRADRRISPLGPPQITYSNTGEWLMGPTDPETRLPTVMTASPLMGVRVWGGEGGVDWENLSPFGMQRQASPFDRLRIEARDVQQMREELQRSVDQNQTPEGQPNQTPSNNLSQPMQQPFDAPQNQTLTPQAVNRAMTAQPLQGAGQPVQAIGDRLMVPPAQQSTQYAELQRRLNRYYTDRLQTDEQRHREFLSQLRAKEAADKAAMEKRTGGDETTTTPPAAGGAVDFGIPDYAKISRELLDAARAASPQAMKAAQEQAATAKPKPVQVKSLAEGIKAGGLANVLRQAEGQMREGKFAAALDQYALAEEVAPNNPLVRLGMAHAELGGGYYKRAEAHLREALTGDPTLLMGQYDLKGMLGQERLETLVKDLKETARKQEDDPGLAFLLAYVAYNAGNEQQAGVYLDLAEKRAGGKDEFFKLLRLHWVLPGGEGAAVQAAPALALSEVLRQFEEGNVASAVLTDQQLRGEFRNAVNVAGGPRGVKSFAVDLPPGAAGGTLGKWIQEHSKGADVKMELTAPTTRPSR